jgi:hypothetical protein
MPSTPVGSASSKSPKAEPPPRKLLKDMTAAERAAKKLADAQTPAMRVQIDLIHDEIVRRKMEDATRVVAAAVGLEDDETPEETKAMNLWRKVIPLDDPACVWRWVMIEVLTMAKEDELQTYCHGYNTCLNESFNSQRAGYASKSVHWRTTWTGRCCCTALHNNHGVGCVDLVMKELGLKLSRDQQDAICAEEMQRVKTANRRNSEEVRMRLMRREKTRKIHAQRTLIEGRDFPKVVKKIPAQGFKGKHLPYILSKEARGCEQAEDSDSEQEDDDDSD